MRVRIAFSNLPDNWDLSAAPLHCCTLKGLEFLSGHPKHLVMTLCKVSLGAHLLPVLNSDD